MFHQKKKKLHSINNLFGSDPNEDNKTHKNQQFVTPIFGRQNQNQNSMTIQGIPQMFEMFENVERDTVDLTGDDYNNEEDFQSEESRKRKRETPKKSPILNEKCKKIRKVSKAVSDYEITVRQCLEKSGDYLEALKRFETMMDKEEITELMKKTKIKTNTKEGEENVVKNIEVDEIKKTISEGILKIKEVENVVSGHSKAVEKRLENEKCEICFQYLPDSNKFPSPCVCEFKICVFCAIKITVQNRCYKCPSCQQEVNDSFKESRVNIE